MRNVGILYLFGFGALMLTVGLACGSSTTPTAAPAPTQEARPTSSASSGSDLVTFTDRNGYYTLDLPEDWKHTSGTDSSSYWYRWNSPGEHAYIENVFYDHGTPLTGSIKGKAALLLLNTFYSSTGKEGDIRISNDKIQDDGSERLTWTSKGGNYSGESFFEVRNSTTFLMFTDWWDNDYTDAYADLLDEIVGSYR